MGLTSSQEAFAPSQFGKGKQHEMCSRVFQPKSVPAKECSSLKSVPAEAEESVKNGDVRSSAKGEKSVRESFEKRRESPRESEPSEEM